MDIIERLRKWKNSPLFNMADLDPSDMEEAADEIQALREALNECAVYFDDYADFTDGEDGQPAPNRAMEMLQFIEATLKGKSHD